MKEVESYGGMYSSFDDIIENLGGTDDEDFLNNVPLEVLLQSIEKQFEEPEEFTNNDFVQAFIDNCEYAKQHLDEDDDITELDERRERFVLEIVKLFEKWLSLGFNDIENTPDAEQNDIIQYTYRFFLMDIKRNFTNLILNYIDENKEALYDRFKDASTASKAVFKNEIDNELDITILSNISPVVDYIMTDISTNLDDCIKFFELCTSDGANINIELSQQYFTEFKICGNFIRKYVERVNRDLLDTIKSKVRNRILKKYPKRTSINTQIDGEVEEVLNDESQV